MRVRRTAGACATFAALAVVLAMVTPAPASAAPHAGAPRCSWPMWGRDPARTFATGCTTITPANAPDLRQIWFFNTHDVVTATPAVVGDSVYVGDWSGRFYALRRSDGTQRWVHRTKRHPRMYAGQIVSSAAVTRVAGQRTVYFGGGKTLYALRASDGSVRWSRELGRTGDGTDPTEIESSPVIVGNTVIVGWDVHNSPAGEPAGVLALDARTGTVKWRTVTAPTTGEGATGSGCGDVWGSPTVDTGRRLVFVGTGNCVTSPKGYGRFAEAVVALDLDDGTVKWTYQPHQPNRDDLDFAGAPNLFTSGQPGAPPRDVVGLGGKDGAYYALDRETGALVWSTPVVTPGLTEPGSNFSTGGFIGPTAVDAGIITGGTAIGGAPYLHGLDTATGAVAWQQPISAPTYGAPALGGGVAVIGGTDFTLRAVELATGVVLWDDEVAGAVSGGPAIVGDDLFAVAGIREPGLDTRSTTSGVYRYSISATPVTSTTRPARSAPSTTAPTGPVAAQSCVGTPCDVPFDLVQPPPGVTPSMNLRVTLDPWRVKIQTSGLGSPQAWIRAGSASAATGATRYGVFISESDDNPQGGLLCVLGADGACSTSRVPKRRAPGATGSYSRITVLAITDSDALPSPAEGINRLVVTKSFDPLLTPVLAKR